MPEGPFSQIGAHLIYMFSFEMLIKYGQSDKQQWDKMSHVGVTIKMCNKGLLMFETAYEPNYKKHKNSKCCTVLSTVVSTN